MSDRTRPLDDETMVRVSVAKRQWERTFDAISEPLMIVDESFVIQRANLALADDLGVAVQRVVGHKCHELRASSSRPFARSEAGPCAGCPVTDALKDSTSRHSEFEAGGDRIYQIRAYPLRDEQVPLCVCRYRDVTEDRALTRQLANAEKLASIGRLAGGVAHEINNPLGGILAFTQILTRDDVTPEERKEYLGEIEKSTLRCKAIVESLLRFARQNPGRQSQRGPLDLNEVVREALRFVHYKFSVRKVQIVTVLGNPMSLFMGNANQMEQVLVNLLSNAFDAIASTSTEGDGRIEITTSRDGDTVILEVADTGPGIPEGLNERLFDPFFTTKEEGKGTGLGLAVTYAIVGEHRGTIRASNRREGGAAFTLAFPVVPGS
ncbi:MAG: ATP-binding protein [Deltaproteobacteria bacterium]|nr:ATP-binding protein [Deltaproteobacteria bacterium]